MEPRVHHCPRCGAPLSVSPGAWAVRCNFCKVDVSLLGPSQQPIRGSSNVAPAAPSPPSPGAIFRRKVILPIATAIFGILALPAFYFLDRNDMTDRAAIMAVVASTLAFVLYGTGRRLLACLLAVPIGSVLLAKPFVRPVMYDGHALSLNSETHFYFLIPGIAMFGVFGLMLVAQFERREFASEDSVLLRAIAAGTFVAGVVLGHFAFGGPTVRDVITQYQPQGATLRQKLYKIALRLPPSGQFEVQEVKLDPAPKWVEGRAAESNIDILTVAELLDPDTRPEGRNFYLSNDLSYCLQWTGPKNPMSSSVMGDRAGDFPARMEHALGLPWVAGYRPGKTGIDIFVIDMRAERVVISTVATGTVGDMTKDRQIVIDALARATGGTFHSK